jgi:hypothetical protein
MKIANRFGNHCSFEVVSVERDAVTIRDLVRGRSVTNDAEHVIEQLVKSGLLTEERKLFYYDTTGTLDEILWEPPSRFVGFAPGPREENRP